jgi:hypothetical protein
MMSVHGSCPTDGAPEAGARDVLGSLLSPRRTLDDAQARIELEQARRGAPAELRALLQIPGPDGAAFEPPDLRVVRATRRVLDCRARLPHCVRHALGDASPFCSPSELAGLLPHLPPPQGTQCFERVAANHGVEP